MKQYINSKKLFKLKSRNLIKLDKTLNNNQINEYEKNKSL